MKSVLAILMLFLVSSAKGATLIMSGVMHHVGGRDPGRLINAPEGEFQLRNWPARLEISSAGSFLLTLSGNTLGYQISTNPLGASYDTSQAGLVLGLPSGDLALPVLTHRLGSFSGCGLAFAAYKPFSHLTDWDIFLIGSGIYIPPGNCRSYFEFSTLLGSIELTPDQVALFSRPDFILSSSGLNLFGKTDPDVVPEPASLLLAAAGGLLLRRRRITEPRSGSPMNSRGFQPPVTPMKNSYPGGVGQCSPNVPPALANPSGVQISFRGFRGFRSFLASPPAIHGEPLRGSMPGGSLSGISSPCDSLPAPSTFLTLHSSFQP